MRSLRAILVGAALLVAVAGAVTIALLGTSERTSADAIPGDGKNTIDVVPSDSGSVPVGDPFTVSIDIVEAELGYQGMQLKLAWDDATVDYVNATYVGPGACIASPMATGAGTAPGSEATWSGCAFVSSGQTATGSFFDVELQCAGEGPTALHLESIAEDASFGTATGPSPGAYHDMVLEDGTVTCVGLPTLTVTKTVNNDDGGLLDVPDFDLFVNGTPVTSGVAEALAPGSYTVSEDDPAPAYTYTIGGDCAPDGSITLASGDDKSCTITNDDQPPTLTVTKTVITDDGGTEGVGDFDLFIDGGAVTSGVANPVLAGAHTVSETDPAPAYTYTIGGDCTAGGDVTLALGEHKTCTIENDDVAPTLTVTKTIIDDSGGGGWVVGDFTLRIDGAPVTSGAPNILLAGAHTVSEDDPAPFYTATIGGDCAGDGSITLAPGDDMTCTIINDDIPPTPAVSIDKKADGSDGPILVTAGGTVTYEWTVTNTGNTDLTDVLVDDDTHNALDKDCGVLVPGATCTDTEAIVLGSVGTVTDTATVTTTELASDSDSVTVNVQPAFDCLFEDDFGRGTTLTTTGSNWEFSWNSEPISGTGVIRVGDQVLLFARSGDAVIFGRGICACGPGSFQAMIFAEERLLLSLVDAGCPPTPTPTATEVPPTPTPTETPIPTEVPPEPNAMAVDAVSGGGVDSSTTLTSTDPFDVDIVVTNAPNAYQAEQYYVEWDPAVLAYDSEAPTNLDGLTMCQPPVVIANEVRSGCVAAAPTTDTGAVHTVTLHCVAAGTSPLHLVSMVEDPTFGTTTALPGETIETTLTDASVTCDLPPDFDCFFSDDFDRGTWLGITDSGWEFGWNGEPISGTGVIRVGDQVLLSSRSGDAMIFGRGICPFGPGSFRAVIFAGRLLLSLVDVTEGG